MRHDPSTPSTRLAEILLVEDNEGDVRLAQEALKDGKVVNHISVVRDGLEAMAFLRREPPYEEAARPDVVLLDLNLPRMDGREVLAEIRLDPVLCSTPVVVLTASDDDTDILRNHEHHADAYVTKPLELDRFVEVVRCIRTFWLEIVCQQETRHEESRPHA
jgi:CheY-like chemotaxis protein